jgi:hypothetical protein
MGYGQRLVVLVVCGLVAFILFTTYFPDNFSSEKGQIWGGLILPIVLIGAGLFVFMGRYQIIKILKIIGILTGIAVVGIGVIITYDYVHEELAKKKIEISVVHAPEKICSKEYPMAVTIENKSSLTIDETSFGISVKREGYSKNLAKWAFNYYSTDKIINPGESYAACWTYPEPPDENKGKYDPKNLIYEISHRSIRFGD